MKVKKLIFQKKNPFSGFREKLFSPPEKISYHKFNKEIFYINLVSGIVFTIIGLYFIGTSQNGHSGDFSSLMSIASEPAIRILPQSAGQLMLFLFGNILVLSGAICIFLALKLVVRYLASRLNN